jgi:hypothetical protein
VVNLMPIAADLVRTVTVKKVEGESPRASTAPPGAARGRVAPRLRQQGAHVLRRLADRVDPVEAAGYIRDPAPGTRG